MIMRTFHPLHTRPLPFYPNSQHGCIIIHGCMKTATLQEVLLAMAQRRHDGDWIVVVAVEMGKAMTDSRDMWEEE